MIFAMSQVVAIIGASDNPDRYAFLAAESLKCKGFEILLINPYKQNILGKPCYTSLLEAPLRAETVTVYVNSERFKGHLKSIVELKPSRIIFNPGTESPEYYSILHENGIEVVEGCTLIMLDSNTFKTY